MALSTSEFVADSLSASSVGGTSGVGPTLASASKSGSGARLVEAWPAGSPDTVRRALFLPGNHGHCYILKDNNYMQGEMLNQDRRHACNIDQARFGKEKSTCINAWKEMRTYGDAMGQTIRDLFSQVNNTKDRDFFLFLPLPCKNKVSQRGKTWRLIRDILSLKDTGWGPPSILVGLLD